MELLLNLAWLLLALPAYWVWRGRTNALTRRVSPFQLLLALGCILVVLFPVISATDDLRAMRAEFEEPAGKHSIRQSGNERVSSSKWQAQPALTSALNFVAANERGWWCIPECFPGALAVPADSCPARSPPVVLS